MVDQMVVHPGTQTSPVWNLFAAKSSWAWRWA